MKATKLNQTRIRREKRARAKLFGTEERPRLSVFRSNAYCYVQLINDETGKTLVHISTREIKGKGKVDTSEQLGEQVAKKAIAKGIKSAQFDRGRYQYHGRVKAIAEGARKGGLQI